MTVVLAVGGIATLELETVDGSPPSVRVTVSGVASTTTFSLTRLCEGRTTTIPGWRAKQFIDTFVDTDWAAPLNRPTTYSLLANGSVVAAATITLTSETAWLQDPLQPDQCLPVKTAGINPGYLTMDGPALKSVTYKNNAGSIDVLGDDYPVAFGGQVNAGSGINASMKSDDQATADQFRDIVRDTPILLLRTTADMVPLPPLAYLKAQTVEQPVTVHWGFEQPMTAWSVTGDLVAAVMQAAVTGSVTYDDVQQLLSGYTYDEVQALAAATTYVDWQKNPLIFSTL
jgi:hypothetical protein